MAWRRALGWRGRHQQDADVDVDEEAEETNEADQDEDEDRRPVRSAKTARTPVGDDADLKPTAMRGNELLYGYLIAGELILVSILNLAVTHGTGAPKHPNHVVEILGLVASVALLGVLQTRHRFIVPFAMILAAYLVVYPKTPNSLTLAHLFALVLPVIYALILMQRQRKASLAQAGPAARRRRQRWRWYRPGTPPYAGRAPSRSLTPPARATRPPSRPHPQRRAQAQQPVHAAEAPPAQSLSRTTHAPRRPPSPRRARRRTPDPPPPVGPPRPPARRPHPRPAGPPPAAPPAVGWAGPGPGRLTSCMPSRGT